MTRAAAFRPAWARVAPSHALERVIARLARCGPVRATLAVRARGDLLAFACSPGCASELLAAELDSSNNRGRARQ